MFSVALFSPAASTENQACRRMESKATKVRGLGSTSAAPAARTRKAQAQLLQPIRQRRSDCCSSASSARTASSPLRRRRNHDSRRGMTSREEELPGVRQSLSAPPTLPFSACAACAFSVPSPEMTVSAWPWLRSGAHSTAWPRDLAQMPIRSVESHGGSTTTQWKVPLGSSTQARTAASKSSSNGPQAGGPTTSSSTLRVVACNRLSARTGSGSAEPKRSLMRRHMARATCSAGMPGER